MSNNSNIFKNKKILIYGLGKSGISTFDFLKKYNEVFLFDDYQKKNLPSNIEKNIISQKKIDKIKFDLIILSPGIDINKCKLKKFLHVNSGIIYTDFDIFYSFNKNTCITVTGTNGKSTTCKLLFDVLKSQKFDVKLVGNIGYPILSAKKIKKTSIFVIEASSYQLEYSKLFRSKYSIITNISPDHLERHRNLNNYISAKFKLFKNQDKNFIGLVPKNNPLIQSVLKKTKFNGKIIKVNNEIDKDLLNLFDNQYFLSNSNKENLSFVIKLAKIFKIKKTNLINTVNKFKGLDYRQQIVFNKKDILVINDSKSTSYSASIEMLKNKKKIYWLIGGIPKKGDHFKLSKKFYQNIKGYIFGINYIKFVNDLKNKIKLKKFISLSKALDAVFQDMKNDDSQKKVILFSPSAASFDSFKNFEERGKYFNKLITKYL
jgi:UDP-N-acetylmuramoylalanine--D-glutamate ligase